MHNKSIQVNFHAIVDSYNSTLSLYAATPELWHKFLKECGMRHISMSRLKVFNKKKYFLAKIKYGF